VPENQSVWMIERREDSVVVVFDGKVRKRERRM
jgi:hypothetical protein